jgi:hypothetical protein
MLQSAVHWIVTGGAFVALPILLNYIARELIRARAIYSALRNQMEGE